MRRLAIGVDMDEVINDMIAKLIEAYNEKYHDNVKYSDLTTYDFFHLLKPECVNPFKEFCSYSFMIDLDVESNAVEALTELNAHHDIYFVTAGYPETMAARDSWLRMKFPFYKPEMLIGCVKKQLLKLDFLVDDYPNNLVGGDYGGLLVNKPWNRNFDNHPYPNIHRIDTLSELVGAIN